MSVKTYAYNTIGVIMIVLFLLVAAMMVRYFFGQPNEDTWQVGGNSTQCINGVVYYVKTKGYQGFMAVAIDSETLMPMRCNLSAN
jgi:TRAP-type mannitol/chloroaromatic compound transport system permease small subunit